jgi:hypothetical protein
MSELKEIPLAATELAAVIFVKELAAHVDEKSGRSSTRETQRKVAAIVREKFFAGKPK